MCNGCQNNRGKIAFWGVCLVGRVIVVCRLWRHKIANCVDLATSYAVRFVGAKCVGRFSFRSPLFGFRQNGWKTIVHVVGRRTRDQLLTENASCYASCFSDLGDLAVGHADTN